MRTRKHSRNRAALTAPETADLFGMNRAAFYDLLSRGEAPVQSFRVGRKVLIARQSVEALLGADAVAAFLDGQYAGASQEAVA